MAGNKVDSQPQRDVLEIYPDLTSEERQAAVDRADEESRELTEWPEVNV